MGQTPVALHGVALRPRHSLGQHRAVTSCTPALCSPSPLKDEAPSRSRAWTPAPRTPGWQTPRWQTPRRAWTPACRTPACRTPYCAGGSFVGSVLKAVSGKGELAPTVWVLGGVSLYGNGNPPTHWGCALVLSEEMILVPSLCLSLWIPWLFPCGSRGLGHSSCEWPWSCLSSLGADGCVGELWLCSLQHAGLGTAPLPSPAADADEAAGGGSVFTKDKSASTPKPIGTGAVTLL